MCLSLPPLQKRFKMCLQYTVQWRCIFYRERTSCIIAGKCPFTSKQRCGMIGKELCTVTTLRGFVNVYIYEGTRYDVLTNRIAKFIMPLYGLAPVGHFYNGCRSSVLRSPWSCLFQPTVTFCINCRNVTIGDMLQVHSAQCYLIKQSLGLIKLSYY